MHIIKNLMFGITRLKYYLLTFLLLELAGGLFWQHDVREKRDRYFAKELETAQVAYAAILNTYERTAQTIYEEIITQPAVLNLLKAASDSDGDQRRRLRDALFQQINPTYQQVWRQQIGLLEFHLANGLNFLSVPNPQNSGAPVVDARYSVNLVNRLQIMVKGFEITPANLGFRYLFPVFADRNYLGSIEIGIAPDDVRQELKRLFRREFLFLFPKDLLGQHAATNDFVETAISGEYLRDKWNVFVHEGESTIETLEARISITAARQIKAQTAFVTRTTLGARDFIVTFLPIADLQRQHVAYLAAYANDQTITGYIRNGYVNMAGLTVVAILLVWVVYLLNREKALLVQREQRLQQINRELQEASQHKSDFLSRMSHELRTPLNAMIGFTALTVSALKDQIAPKYLQHLTKAEQSAHTLLELINDILDFSKIEAGKMDVFIEDIELRDILDDVLLTAEGLLGDKPVRLHTDIPPELPPLRSDYTKVKQILNNLLSNAIKFTAGGYVAVRTIPMTEQQMIRIELEDTGCGIPPEKLARLFESFEQADSSITKRFGGTGLGLAITKKLCDLLKIDIGVQSALGQGTMFWLHLPAQFDAVPRTQAQTDLVPQAAPQEATVPALPSKKVLNTASLLVVDDNEVTLHLFEEIFTRAGYTVYKAQSGTEALRLAQERRPDVVLMDLAMPEMDGFETTAYLKQHPATAAIPVIACTAMVTKEVQARALQIGCADYITKPIEPKHLLDQVSKIVFASKKMRKSND